MSIEKRISRRDFLKVSVMAVLGAAVQACAKATATPQPTKPVAAPTATPKPAEPTKPAVVAPTATPKPAAKYNEAPALAELVKAGKLPPVEQRLPTEPLVVQCVEEIGKYGGTWRRVAIGPMDVGMIQWRFSYASLLRYTALGEEIVPNVAKKWEVSPDGSEFTFYLRKGMKWSDGKPNTADDWAFWYEDVILNKDLTPAFPTWLKVKGEPVVMSKVDDYTIKFKFTTSNGLFVQQIATADGVPLTMYPKHYLSQFHPKYAKKEDLDKKAADAKLENWWSLFWNRQGWQNVDCPRIWPWVLTKVPPDIPAIAERNPYYWMVDTQGNQLPYIDRMRFDVVEKIDMLNVKAVAGEVDCQFRHLSWVYFPLYIENAQKGGYRVMKWSLAEGSNCCLHPNLNHKDAVLRKLMETKEFRQALSLGLNRKEINEIAYQGMGTPRQASVLPQCPYFKPAHAEAYAQYDPKKANQMLDAIGLTAKDEEGMRKRPDGQKLTITIEYAPVFGPWADVVQIVCKQWKEIAIRAIPKEEARELFTQRGQAGTEQDMSIWMMDRCLTPLLQPLFWLPQRGGTPASVAALYWDWYETGGKTGEKPSPEVQKAYDLYDKCKTARSNEELTKSAIELMDLNAEQVWFIGTVGLLPHVGVVKHNFRNVPEKAVSDWLVMTPGNTYIEQYFFKP